MREVCEAHHCVIKKRKKERKKRLWSSESLCFPTVPSPKALDRRKNNTGTKKDAGGGRRKKEIQSVL